MLTCRRSLAALLLFVVVAGLGLADRPAPEAPRKDEAKAVAATTPDDAGKVFHGKLLQVAREYKGYELVDGTGRWSPVACSIPFSAPVARFSASKDEETHGKKIYLLYAHFVQDIRTYIEPGKPAAVGQAIVKEAWKPEAIDPKDLKDLPAFKEFGDRGVPSAKQDGKTYYATEKKALFIMVKLDPKTPGTDEGWVYGTVTPDGKQVTSAGKVESCMRCHQQAKNDRLFGLPKEKTE
jgi:hypothetical protein